MGRSICAAVLLLALACVAYAHDPVAVVTTTDGQTFNNVTVLKVEGDTVLLVHSEGAARVPLSSLSDDTRKALGLRTRAEEAASEAKQAAFAAEQAKNGLVKSGDDWVTPEEKERREAAVGLPPGQRWKAKGVPPDAITRYRVLAEEATKEEIERVTQEITDFTTTIERVGRSANTHAEKEKDIKTLNLAIQAMEKELREMRGGQLVIPPVLPYAELRVGQIGVLQNPYRTDLEKDFQFKVAQVVDAKNMLMEIRFVHDELDDLVALVWITGVDTAKLADGMDVKPIPVFLISSNKTYTTALGSQKTVMLLEAMTVPNDRGAPDATPGESDVAGTRWERKCVVGNVRPHVYFVHKGIRYNITKWDYVAPFGLSLENMLRVNQVEIDALPEGPVINSVDDMKRCLSQ